MSSVTAATQQQTSPGVESLLNCPSCELDSQVYSELSGAKNPSYRVSAPALLACWLAAGKQRLDQSDDGTVRVRAGGEGGSAHWYQSLPVVMRLMLRLQKPKGNKIQFRMRTMFQSWYLKHGFLCYIWRREWLKIWWVVLFGRALMKVDSLWQQVTGWLFWQQSNVRSKAMCQQSSTATKTTGRHLPRDSFHA